MVTRVILTILDRILMFGRQQHGWAEFWSGLGLTLWMLINATNPHVLPLVSYGPILGIAHEGVWESVTLICGMVQMIGAVLDNWPLRFAAAFAATFLYSVFGFCLILAFAWPFGATGCYFALAGLNFTAMVKYLKRRRDLL